LIEDENEVCIAGVDEHEHSNNNDPTHSNVFTVNLQITAYTLGDKPATNSGGMLLSALAQVKY